MLALPRCIRHSHTQGSLSNRCRLLWLRELLGEGLGQPDIHLTGNFFLLDVEVRYGMLLLELFID